MTRFPRLVAVLGMAAVFFVSAPLWGDDTHGGGAPELPDTEIKAAPQTGNVPVLRQGSPDKDVNADNNPKVKKKGAGKKSDESDGPTQALILINVGPRVEGGQPSKDALDIAQRLEELAKTRIPEATVLTLTPFSSRELQRVPARAGLAPGNLRTITAFFIGPVESSPGALRILGGDGWEDEKPLGETLGRVAKGLGVPCFNEPCGKPMPEQFPRAALHAIFLASFSGDLACGHFPGPVYGITKANEELLFGVVRNRLAIEALSPREPFPISARDWFDSARLTANNRHVGWYCPHPGRRGYAGEKEPNKSLARE